MAKFYITTPIYYANDLPHIGHDYTTVAADVLARWYRMTGREVFFLTGTDEHGAKIVQAAEKAGKKPKEFVDGISAEFKNDLKLLDITNDSFIRTTDPVHEKVVSEFFAKLHADGKIYKKKYEGLYCVHCEKFLSPGDLNEDLCCPDHKVKPVTQSEENWFFKLSEYQDRLVKLLSDENDPGHLAVYPLERRNEIIGKLKTGLQDISISRASLKWGIPMPFDREQVFYVWVDALLNYISAIGIFGDRKKFDELWPADLHLTAKDILWFHAVIWPAMLLAYGLRPPKKLFSHGYFTINGDKMSKTLGNVIRAKELVGRFGVDATRYLLLLQVPFGSDGDVSFQAMTERYNTDLANNLGNLVSRTLTMMEKYLGGIVPEGAGGTAFGMEEELSPVPGMFDRLEFNRIAEQIQKAIDKANRNIESSAPWKMAKQNDPALAGLFYGLLRSIGTISIHLAPFMPGVSQKIWESIGQAGNVTAAASDYFAGKAVSYPVKGNKISKPAILFPRIQDK
jgi:methionyl-tRNA synthetase